MQYVLILRRALFGETDVRNAWTHVDWGVVGEHPTEAIWGRRQCRCWKESTHPSPLVPVI